MAANDYYRRLHTPLTMTQPESHRTVYRVSELAASARELLEYSFPLLWVEGEISNLAKPRSGHWYFTLKDDRAQIRCAMFANRNRLLRRAPVEGNQVQVRARVSLYLARGDFQLIVESLEDAGEGALRRAFEQLSTRLSDEGLFDDAHKRALPAFPRRIGVITSATGAAIRDVCSVLRRRFPAGQVLVHPVPVQGDAAPAAIVQALEVAGARAECDVLLLVRGGGSLEDLQAFNEETVARAIHACPLPIVAGVGHEIDVTIADFAADLRAATPSAAAELVCPNLDEKLRDARLLARRCMRSAARHMADAGQRFSAANRSLERAHPQRQIERRMQRLDELELRLRRSAQQHMQRSRGRLQVVTNRLNMHHPGRTLEQPRRRLSYIEARLHTAVAHALEVSAHRYRLAGAALNTVSPLRTLARGYAIVEDAQQRVVTRVGQLTPGDEIAIRLGQGQIGANVTRTSPNKARQHGKV